MISVEEFRKKIQDNSLDELLDGVILADSALYVTDDNIAYARGALASKYSIAEPEITVKVVGSAKLGFAMTPKRIRTRLLPRYRSYSAYSDIDLVIVSPRLFQMVWHDLCSYAHRVARLPWDSGALGDYLVCGWLRPDHFPNHVRLRQCDDWWDVFRDLSADKRFGRRKVRGGLFYDLDHVRKYQARALADCVRFEEIEK